MTFFRSRTFVSRVLIASLLMPNGIAFIPSAHSAQVNAEETSASSWVSVDAVATLGATTKDVRNDAGLKGLLIEKMDAIGTAKNADLQVGDVILAFNNISTADQSALNGLLSKAKVGSKAQFKINRAGKMMTLEGAIVGDDAPATQDEFKAVVAGDTKTIPAGTKVELLIETPISSNKSKKGDVVAYTVKSDIADGEGKVLIKAGAKAGGVVNMTKSAGAFGKKGKLEFTAEWVETVDGQTLPLRSTQAANGKSNQTVAIATIVFLSILGGFIKGKNITLDRGTIVPAFTNADFSVASKA